MKNLRRKRLGNSTLTSYDQYLERIKSNKLVKAVLILLIIYTGISEIIKKTNENKENLFGEKGLLKKNDTVSSPKIQESDTANKSNVKAPAIGSPQANRSFNKITIQRLIKRDTITFVKKDTVYIIDTSKPNLFRQKYSYRLDDLKEGGAFVDPLTNSTISVYRIQSDFTASAILDYPDGFNTVYFEKPDPIKVRPGDSWNNIYYHKKNYKLTIVSIDFINKTFSVEIQENN
jgi:hypothetical protein